MSGPGATPALTTWPCTAILFCRSPTFRLPDFRRALPYFGRWHGVTVIGALVTALRLLADQSQRVCFPRRRSNFISGCLRCAGKRRMSIFIPRTVGQAAPCFERAGRYAGWAIGAYIYLGLREALPCPVISRLNFCVSAFHAAAQAF